MNNQTKIMDMREYNPEYHANGRLVWKKIGEKTGQKGRRKKKTYPSIRINKIQLKDTYEINEDVLEASRKQFQESGELIPVFLSYELTLLSGYEQYLLAKELGRKKIPFQRKPMNKKEQKTFSHKVTNKKFGNHKYCVTTVDGKDEYTTLNKMKEVWLCRRICGKYKNLKLVYFGNLKFAVTDLDGNVIVGGQKGKSIKSLKKYLCSHIYKDGEFIKKSDSKK